MEAIGLGVGVVGLVGLFSTCIDMVERWDSYKDFSLESGAIRARFFADRVRFRQWGQSVGMSAGAGEGKPDDHYHSALDDPTVRSAVDLILHSIENLNDATKSWGSNLAHSSDPADLQLEGNALFSHAHAQFAKLQITPSRRSKVRWALRDKARTLNVVASFEALVQKLYDLIPPGEVIADSQRSDQERQGKLSTGIANSSLWHEDAQRILSDFEKYIHYETRKELRDWLDAPDTKRNYDDFVHRRLYGTCDWILCRPQFQRWKSFPSKTPRILWINGPPGYGKTVLCARLIEYMSISEPNLAYFFFSSEIESRADAFVVMRSWIAQLLAQGLAFDIIKGRWEAAEERSISKTDVKEIFSTLIQNLPPCTFVVDGLDECSVAGDTVGRDNKDSLFDFLRFLAPVICDSESQVLIVSRNDVRIREGLSADGNGTARHFVELHISPKDVKADASTFSQSVVTRKLRNKTETQRRVLADRLADRCESMFLAIKLLEDDLRGGMSLKQLQRAIDNAPKKLDHIYDRDWERIQGLDNSSRRCAFSILRWVTFAVRPLTVLEITECLLLPDGHDDDEIDYEELPDSVDQVYVRTEILELCGSLIEIRAKSKSDIGDSTIHLTHFSVKQYILCHMHIDTTGLLANQRLVSSNESIQNNVLAKACVRYLNSDQTWDETWLGGCYDDTVLIRPFREYAANLWSFHVCRGVVNSGEILHIMTTVCRLIRHQAEERKTSGNPLFHASLLGLTETVDYLIDEVGLGVDHIDSSGRTALLAAVSTGHMSGVAHLLAKGANANTKTHDGTTPLQVAAFRGDVDIMQLLLRNGSDLDMRDGDGWTPLVAASHGGHVEAVRLLLDEGAQRDVLPEFDPLFIAIYRANTQLVNLLIEKGADLGVKPPNGFTPLLSASDLGHTEIVKLLLVNGADIEASSLDGRTTPLVAASSQNHVEVVEVLLDNRANLGAPTKSDQMAMRIAVQGGFVDIIRLFLDKGFSVESIDPIYGRSLLSYATEHENIRAVEYLLQRGADPNLRDKLGRSPLSFAAYFGNVALLTSLLSKGTSCINHPDIYGSTMFSIAVRHGRVDLVQYLLKRGGVDLTSKDKFGRTVAFWAKTPDIRRILARAANQHEATAGIFDSFLSTHPPARTVGRRECDVCTLRISVDGRYFHCSICVGGDFDICDDCCSFGACCLDDSHELLQRVEMAGG
ncbi:hypothetical protein O1611_g1496 [Lasiodiplodia mahajangana]|uniref:Uncharacterized protein n=1 Tax=Lasiodiplodia mahajangana TaxID=1108764 RepID=A0ACC2JX84_9PEZI|nr:hypothetical protein O1611_g1496 [Lasiodiplodia mahajangana]